ncbi:MAG: NADH-quinone oxidoreductase subunit C [Lachnospiraceae bacterium]|nr:NADH-quinone oxidoreductase subunit C [Lachnospiraceae bacterium]
MLENIEEIALETLLNKAKEVKTDGGRIMQICATKIGEQYEILYTFGKEYEVRHLKVVIDPGTHVPSITDIFEGAYLYENEMKDLFGIEIDGLSHDYNGKLYRTAVKTPFA